MREIRTSGLTRGSNGTGASRPLFSTLLVNSQNRKGKDKCFSHLSGPLSCLCVSAFCFPHESNHPRLSCSSAVENS